MRTSFEAGDEILPCVYIFDAEFLPERVNQLDSNGDVPDQFAELIIAHNKARFGELVFPNFTRVMKENTGDQKIEIQLRIKRRDLCRHAHHLRRMLDQSAATRVMIFARGCGATKAIAPLVNEHLRQSAQPGISELRHGLPDKVEIGRLFGA